MRINVDDTALGGRDPIGIGGHWKALERAGRTTSTVRHIDAFGRCRMASQTYNVCSIPIAAIDTEEAANRITTAAIAGERFEVHLCNAYTLSLVDQDDRLREALLHADLNLADGTPVAWLGRKLGMSSPVRGPSLVTAACREGRLAGVRHYFYGGLPGVAERMTAQLLRRVPGLQVAGYSSPPIGDPSDAQLRCLADELQKVRAHIVWVGLGTPRQDYVVPRIAEAANLVVIPVGAAFDFLSGAVKQAPAALHGTGLEWLYRLGTEPRRLWRRYLIGNPRFVVQAARHGRAQ